MSVPEKHRAIAHAWIDGAEIEMLNDYGAWIARQCPSWDINSVYRIKPKAKVKKWQWVYPSAQRESGWNVTNKHLSETEAKHTFSGCITKIDSTLIEVDEE